METLLRKDYIYDHLRAESRDKLFEIMGGRLEKEGITKNSYVAALKEREEKYPTGLHTDGLLIAMPHTDSAHVNEACISIARLENPIPFHEMGNKKNTLDVEMVFMLALKDPEAHLKILQKIIGMFSDREVLKKLREAETAKKIYQVVYEAADS